jgi:hypothetical protein
MSPRWLATFGFAALLCACNGQMASDPAPADPAAPATPESSSEPSAPNPSAPNAEPGTTECNGEPCTPPNQCVRYSGIAGPRVPLYACGIPCAADGACPAALKCQVIADGPRLCR